MLQPLNDRIIIKREEVKQYTESGLTIPESAQEKPLRGVVVAKGAKVCSDIEVGHTILFGKVDGVAIDSKYMDEDGDYIMIRDEQVRGIFS